jgi:hypothetical protein
VPDIKAFFSSGSRAALCCGATASNFHGHDRKMASGEFLEVSPHQARAKPDAARAELIEGGRSCCRAQ